MVSKLWTHIKANNLQNPEKKTEIILDDHLKTVFKVDSMTMFAMNKLLAPHFRGAVEVAAPQESSKDEAASFTEASTTETST